ncbi:MAG TPA: ATP-binding protein [Candidatus Dormibacteraeota bacterium]|nr:ATP-binding protein [Candidatus Dormibacteraeota bacterium]
MSERTLQPAHGGAATFAPRVGRSPAFFSRYSSVLLLLLLVALEAGVVRFVIRDVHSANSEVQRMYASSVLGLRRIGSLQYDAQETRRSTLYALTTNDSNLQVVYADQSREADARVTAGIAEYLQQAHLPQEVELGHRLERDWKAYLAVRDEVLASILEGSIKEAVTRDLADGVPFFDRMRRDLEETQRLYDEQASLRLANVAELANRSVTRLLSVLIVTVLIASVFVWVLQRDKMASMLQMARMQMDFAASVSHELRTPLAVLCSAVDNIADGVVSGKEQLAKYGTVIRNQSRQINGLVNQVILFVSTQDGKGRYTLHPVAVSDVVESAVTGTTELIRKAGFALEQHIDPHLPRVLGDPAALSQCLQNLITNALKYADQGRWIAIRASEGGTKDHREVRISVQDHGKGIDRNELHQIFEPFYRSPAAVAGQIHGTGLGLPIAKSLAEAMGGRISVTSEVGIGSTFTLHLPVVEEINESEGSVGKTASRK